MLQLNYMLQLNNWSVWFDFVCGSYLITLNQFLNCSLTVEKMTCVKYSSDFHTALAAG
jgi:hypothetical protein